MSLGPWVRGALRAALGRGRAFHALESAGTVLTCLPASAGMVLDDIGQAMAPCPGAPMYNGATYAQGPATPQAAPISGPRPCPSASLTVWDGRSWEAPWGLWPGAMGLFPTWGLGAEASGLGRGQGAPVSVEAGRPGRTAVGLPAGWGRPGPSTHSGPPCLSTCPGGRVDLPEAPCPGTCSVLGWRPTSPRLTKGAARRPGDCSYVLAKVRGLPTGPAAAPEALADPPGDHPGLGGRSGEAEAGLGGHEPCTGACVSSLVTAASPCWPSCAGAGWTWLEARPA